MINKHIIVFYSAIGLFFVYYLQGVLYPSGSFLSQFCLIIYLMIGVYCSFHSLFMEKADALTYTWGTFALMLLLTFLASPPIVHGTTNEAIGEVSTFSQFKESLSLSLTFFITRYAGRNSIVSNKQFFYLGLAFFILSFIRFRYTGIILEQENDGSIGVTNNSAYFIVVTLPFLFFIYDRSKLLAGFLLVISTSLIILGAKRGAILCAGITIIFSLLYYLKKSEFSYTRNFIAILIVSLLIFYSFKSYQSNEYLIHRIEKTEDVGMGPRYVAYSTLLDHWNNEQDPMKFLFGNGAAQSINICGNYAHNDWLELLIDNGLLGVCIYLTIFILSFMKIHRSDMFFSERIACYSALIIWFGKSIYSMGYTGFENAILFILLGLLPSRNEIEWEEEEEECEESIVIPSNIQL